MDLSARGTVILVAIGPACTFAANVYVISDFILALYQRVCSANKCCNVFGVVTVRALRTFRVGRGARIGRLLGLPPASRDGGGR